MSISKAPFNPVVSSIKKPSQTKFISQNSPLSRLLYSEKKNDPMPHTSEDHVQLELNSDAGKPNAMNYSTAEPKDQKEKAILQKYGIKKINPSLQGSRMRQPTN